MDDVGLGDTTAHLIDRIPYLEAEANNLGLSLNHTKCEVVGLAPEDIEAWRVAGLDFAITDRREACLLGSPLSPEGVDAALMAHATQLKEIGPRLGRLSSHEAFYMLKTCFAIPRLLFLLRSAPAFASSCKRELAEVVKDTFSSIVNIQLEDKSWTQASLPVRWGGTGIRDVESLAPSAYLASYHSTDSLVRSILPPFLSSGVDPLPLEAVSSWLGQGGVTQPKGEDAARQRAWDEEICCAKFNLLLSHSDQHSQARLLAVSSPDAGVWIHTLPCRNLGLCLSDRELRVAVGLRLGAPLVRDHVCVCGAQVDGLALHGLSCRHGKGRQRRHAQANDVLVRAIRASDVQAELEPHSLLQGCDKRPDGATLDPWRQGKFLVWDFTCPDTLAPSHVAQSASTVGSAACKAEQNKRHKYAELVSSIRYLFVPIAIETLGTWGASATEICREIGSRLATLSGDPRSHLFLKHGLSLAVQRGNAAAIAGTLPTRDNSL